MNRNPWKSIVRLTLMVAIFFLMPYSHIVHARATRADPRVRERQPEAQSTVPTIEFWYGTAQTFGGRGLPQDRINILGNLSPSENYTLEYQINGSAFQPVTLGGAAVSNVRLVNVGDFNIELFDPNYDQAQARIDVPPELRLLPGENTLVLRVIDQATEEEVVEARREVTIDYTPLGEKTWPLPYQTDWNSAGSISADAQVVDGKWAIAGDGVRILEPGYDRVVGIGSTTWDDYEVRTSFLVHAVDPGYVGGIGVILGWQGHYLRGTESPTAGWAELGAYGYFSFRLGQRQVMRLSDQEPALGPLLDFELDRRIHVRMQVETDPNDAQVSHYRLKMWNDGDPEPEDWGLELVDTEDRRPHGSVLLVAHLVEATFGDVSVEPLNPVACNALDVGISGSGSVLIDPQQDCYSPGDSVTLTAQPADGFAFAGWSVDGGSDEVANPLVLEMTGDRSVRATFVPVSPPVEVPASVYLPMVVR